MTYFNYRILYSEQVMLARSILESVTLLGVRVYLFTTFFFAGFNKLKNWESTLFLFEYEYAVPFLPHEFAAYLGTASEIILPSLLLLGILTPFAALGLFIFNIVAVLSLADMAPAAFLLHVIWGGILFSLIVWGAGKASLDSVLFSGKGAS
jgi:putative oxidoreductase